MAALCPSPCQQALRKGAEHLDQWPSSGRFPDVHGGPRGPPNGGGGPVPGGILDYRESMGCQGGVLGGVQSQARPCSIDFCEGAGPGWPVRPGCQGDSPAGSAGASARHSQGFAPLHLRHRGSSVHTTRLPRAGTRALLQGQPLRRGAWEGPGFCAVCTDLQPLEPNYPVPLATN